MSRFSSSTHPGESSTHERAIEALARQSHVPIDHVAQLYEYALAVLTVGARITGFLTILMARNLWKEQPYDPRAVAADRPAYGCQGAVRPSGWAGPPGYGACRALDRS